MEHSKRITLFTYFMPLVPQILLDHFLNTLSHIAIDLLLKGA